MLLLPKLAQKWMLRVILRAMRVLRAAGSRLNSLYVVMLGQMAKLVFALKQHEQLYYDVDIWLTTQSVVLFHSLLYLLL
jgi:hypothetical protein